MEKAHRSSYVFLMSTTQPVAPSPWVSRHVVRAGGLLGAGFADGADLLLVATHDGRGLIDCLTGQRVARDPDPNFPFDEARREVAGIGQLTGSVVKIAGSIVGGTLTHATEDGWRLVGVLTNSGDDIIRLVPPDGGVDEQEAFSGFVPEVRVFGFSPTGRSFVIGTGAELFIFAR